MEGGGGGGGRDRFKMKNPFFFDWIPLDVTEFRGARSSDNDRITRLRDELTDERGREAARAPLPLRLLWRLRRWRRGGAVGPPYCLIVRFNEYPGGF